jgi:hypothetical protein
MKFWRGLKGFRESRKALTRKLDAFDFGRFESGVNSCCDFD